jgi:wyosine [tRNA(Phe)-imidazoG37] synthetase (radical SAM superfamily)
MKYIYGPLKSRRLGLSLGISLTPYKYCSFDCIYCQLGNTTVQTKEIKEYVKIAEVEEELRQWLEDNKDVKLDYITISGCGEPTLNSKIGLLIEQLKKITNIPIAVITNTSLVNIDSVRKDLLNADLIVPSLNTVNPKDFLKINRPLADINIQDIIDGLIKLKNEFKGKIWLEIMIVKGVNDDSSQAKKLKSIIDKINPDKIQLNSPVRVTAENNILSADRKTLKEIKAILGDRCEIL